tara:strand:+ start:243 stop:746 length:504 start_codon:yes stop_codon:yes gene_type:complete
MKIVIQTQVRENYAAHNEDYVQGVTQDYWKYKGGRTFVVNNVTIAQSQDDAFWQSLTDAVTEMNESFEEYVLSNDLVDECDFDLRNFVEPWETPVTLEKDLFTEGFVALRKTINGEYGYMRKEVLSKYERWLQIGGEQKDYSSSFEFVNGKILPYKESCDYLKELAA